MKKKLGVFLGLTVCVVLLLRNYATAELFPSMYEAYLPPLPEPAIMILFGVALIGLGTLSRKKGMFVKRN